MIENIQSASACALANISMIIQQRSCQNSSQLNLSRYKSGSEGRQYKEENLRQVLKPIAICLKEITW
jgi:hypothetical protein